MDTEEIIQRVNEIKDDPTAVPVPVVTEEDEHKRRMEYDLYVEVLLSIRDGTCPDPKGAAAAALECQALSFVRW